MSRQIHPVLLLIALLLPAAVSAADSGRFFQALYRNDTNRVAALLADPRLLTATNRSGLNPLMLAAAFGYRESTALLLAKGAAVNAAVTSGPQQGKSALFFAAGGGHAAVVKQLLAAGAAADRVTPQNHTPLTYAAAAGYPQCVALLLKAGADRDRVSQSGVSILGYAAAWHRKRVCNQLLEAGVREPAALAQRGPMGALLAAYLDGIREAHFRAVYRALDRGLTPRAATGPATNRRPLLVQAASRGHNRIVWILLLQGARLERRDGNGNTALLAAVAAGYGVTGHMLLEAGADPNAADSKGYTPLIHAAAGGQEDLVRYLLRAGARLNTAAADGTTALSAAVSNKRFKTAKLLNNWQQRIKK